MKIKEKNGERESMLTSKLTVLIYDSPEAHAKNAP